MRGWILGVFLFCSVFSTLGQQEDAWFYIRTQDTVTLPFQKEGDKTLYTGQDKTLKRILDSYEVKQFKKTLRKASKENINRTYFVRVNSEALFNDLLENASHIFVSGDLIPEEDKKIYEPNDYGLTSTIGENLGAQVNLDYLDFLDVPKAWYYTTGNPEILVGISDGYVDTLDREFTGRTKMFRKSSLSKGHGYSVAETAAGSGNNAFGIAGICYNCSVGTTSFRGVRTLDELLELSKAGAKVINCSWGVTFQNEKAQDVINQMLDNGTIIVAIGHNPSFSKTKGKKLYYPASYDGVIGISSAMHRYENHTENILGEVKEDTIYYYAENIRGYVGRTAGFRDNDTLKKPYIYPVSIRNLNHAIDMVAPATGIFRYGELALHNKNDVSIRSQTSGVAPLITGTIGLMFSLYPCLPTDEVESILKMTSWNIDHIEVNKPYAGLYGAGMLQTGDAVEMVYKLYNEKETAYIKDQDFSRWNFKLTALSKELRIQDQKFRESATLDVKAKHSIVIGPNTYLKPNAEGSIQLKIDPSLQKECELVLRDPSIMEE